jgi:hypothetical protein
VKILAAFLCRDDLQPIPFGPNTGFVYEMDEIIDERPRRLPVAKPESSGPPHTETIHWYHSQVPLLKMRYRPVCVVQDTEFRKFRYEKRC